MREKEGLKFFTTEQMGSVTQKEKPQSMLLNTLFIWEHLRFAHTETRVGCPFCNKGELILIHEEPVFSSGLRTVEPEDLSKETRIGEECEFFCNKCNANFIGTRSNGTCVD